MRIGACVVRVLSVVAGVRRWCGGVGVGGAGGVAVRVRIGRVASNGWGWIGVVHSKYIDRMGNGFVCKYRRSRCEERGREVYVEDEAVCMSFIASKTLEG